MNLRALADRTLRWETTLGKAPPPGVPSSSAPSAPSASFLLVLVVGLWVAAMSMGCSSAVQKQPPGVPPTPSSISKDQPGGDADNPEVAAQERLLTEPWGMRADREGVLMLGLPDPTYWRRVKFWLVDTFTGFRYGDDHHAVAALFLRDAPFAGADSDACLRDFEQWLDGQAKTYDAQASEGTSETVRWRGDQLVVRKREASVRWGFSTKRYAAAYGSYVFWNGTCATLGYAVPMKADETLAIRVRDRLADEGFSRLVARGNTKPLEPACSANLARHRDELMARGNTLTG